MKTSAPQFLEVTEAKYVSGYNLLVNFDDGTRRVVDFGPFLKQAKNPMITKYRSIKEFKSFHIRNGDLMWGDFEMIFPIMDLYEGNIFKGGATTPSHFVLSDAVSPVKTVLKKKTKTAATVSYRKTKSLIQRAK
jgi:Protein of unknown function (DUF2442)